MKITLARLRAIFLLTVTLLGVGCEDNDALTGSAGDVAGAAGNVGSAGHAGSVGASGSSGSTGNAGSGVTGGEAGSFAEAGAAGDVGTGGNSGNAGTAGSAGMTGIAGTAGTAGAAGSAGGPGGTAATGFTVTGANGVTTINAAGGTLQLSTAVIPAGAVTPGVTWSSGSPSVATVDGSGLVTAVSNGTSVITASAVGASGVTGTLSISVSFPFVYFVQQANAPSTATLAAGVISVANTYGASGNAFKYVAPNYYGTVSNGFIAFPTPISGDFSATAEVTIVTQNKANNACGIGLGVTTGFNGTDSYAYALMRNSSNVVNGYYVSGAGAVSAGSPTVAFTNGTPLALSFSRTGTNFTYGAGPVGGALTTQTAATSLFTNGTTVYGSGPLYPAISFNNVVATITKLVIKDGTGATLFDSATGALVSYVPPSLSVSAASVDITKGSSTTVTATALAGGGGVSSVTAVSADPTVATAVVSAGATSSSIMLTGLKGGVTTVTVTNTSDSNTVTNTKTIAVAVDDYATTDGYGSLSTRTYPATGATSAYTDGELALTFDAPPVLNSSGTIKIYKLSDGTQVDSIAFAGEAQTYGTTTINVGSQLARISGNTLLFTPHLGKLAYGTGYYVAVPTTSVTGTLNGIAFNGLSNLSAQATWKFTTRAAPTVTATNVTVDGAQTSTANFRTVEGALNAVAALTPAPASVKIIVAAGTYSELLRYTGPGAATPQTVDIVGPVGNTRGNTCILQFANGNAMNGSTQTRASAYFTGVNLILENLTLKNTATRAAVSQAEALYFASGTGFNLAAFNSSFSSNQDTIQTSGRSWFYNTYIEGNVDFIWGTGDVALFENSSLRFINDLGAAASYSLFVARTGTSIAAGANGTVGKGYVLLNSTVSVDANVTAYFGRDAGVGAFYDQVTLINDTFTGAGAIGAGIWNVTTPPLSLGDSSYVGWKSAGVTGLNLATLTTDPKTSAVVAGQATEFDTRDHILNRVVTVTATVPTGFQAAATTWDVSPLAAAWGAL